MRRTSPTGAETDIAWPVLDVTTRSGADRADFSPSVMFARTYHALERNELLPTLKQLKQLDITAVEDDASM